MCALALPAEAAPHRAGRVVRVERPRRSAPDPVHLCMLANPSESRMTCYGKTPPEPGSRFALIDESGMRARVVVKEATRSSFDACQLGTAHDVLIEAEEGAVPTDPSGGSYYIVAVRGVEVSEGGRLLRDTDSRGARIRPPSGRSTENVWTIIDRDGDSEPDMLGTAYDCSAEVPDLPAPRVGQKLDTVCIDYWSRDAAEWTQVGRDIFFNCW
jgi:hypothetical protein